MVTFSRSAPTGKLAKQQKHWAAAALLLVIFLVYQGSNHMYMEPIQLPCAPVHAPAFTPAVNNNAKVGGSKITPGFISMVKKPEGAMFSDSALSFMPIQMQVGKSNSNPPYFFYVFPEERDLHISATMIKKGGMFEPKLHENLAEVIEENGGKCGIVVDMGCNFGPLTLDALSKGCTTMSFDIQEEVLFAVRSSIILNGWQDRALLINAAVSDKAGDTIFYRSPLDEEIRKRQKSANMGGVGVRTGPGGAEETHKTFVDTIVPDGYFESLEPGDVDLLKMDIEGSEEKAINGMSKTLSRGVVKNLCMETRPNQVHLLERVHNEFGFECRISSLINYENVLKIPTPEHLTTKTPFQTQALIDFIRDAGKDERLIKRDFHVNLICTYMKK